MHNCIPLFPYTFIKIDADFPNVNISLTEEYKTSPIVQLDALDMSSGTSSVDVYMVNG